MAIMDFPRVPEELSLRIAELNRKMKGAEISRDDVIQNTIAALGKTRIDSNGIRTSGDFGEIVFDTDDLKAFIESGASGIDVCYIFKGKEFYVKTGNKIEKVRIGFPPVTREVAEIPEADAEEMAIVEFLPDQNGNYPEKRLPIIFNFLKKRLSQRGIVPDPGFVIYNHEAFAGFMENWKEFSTLLNVSVSLSELTTKKKIIQTGESAFMLIADILKRCGV